MTLKTHKEDIDLETYKKYTTQEFLPWDEKYISAILTYNRNYTYLP